MYIGLDSFLILKIVIEHINNKWEEAGKKP